ncbi:adenosylcobinamide-phosphate synthase CbiB [Clostridium formicaceticum]|uniref:Cobalamin biosynthesis protein CobD n=1 Tax=Clostridium formicaceticum TaxID=1497 RepID=A0AAC9RJP6_9CLOT|nr:adenosylcobinamide-phosphate synthase CbiB [Clostridium formicaceticum]AOY76349.1 cobalamin biosynthesis protein CobD [Clostridium formicaceticum]ARE86740.1 cobalamin biosynthesis protein [Clostridium formicaceticum]
MKLLLSAYILDLILGDPQGFPHPVRYIGNLIAYLEKKLLNLKKSTQHQFIMGMFLSIIVIATTYILTLVIITFAYSLHAYVGIIVSVLLGYTVLATKSLDVETRKVYKKLEGGSIEDARVALSYIVGRDTEDLDEKEITRATIETIGENISDGIIAPMFYFFIGGVPLAMAYKAANTLDSMVGYKNDKYLYFGRFSARFDDVVNYIPARLTALFIIIASLLKGKNYSQSIKTVLKDSDKHNSPNAGYPEAAVAGALEIQLGGTNKYFGKEVYKPTIGNAVDILNKSHIIKTIDLMYWTSAVAILFFTILKLIVGGWSYGPWW